jgi:hypothetical protein
MHIYTEVDMQKRKKEGMFTAGLIIGSCIGGIGVLMGGALYGKYTQPIAAQKDDPPTSPQEVASLLPIREEVQSLLFYQPPVAKQEEGGVRRERLCTPATPEEFRKAFGRDLQTSEAKPLQEPMTLDLMRPYMVCWPPVSIPTQDKKVPMPSQRCLICSPISPTN